MFRPAEFVTCFTDEQSAVVGWDKRRRVGGWGEARRPSRYRTASAAAPLSRPLPHKQHGGEVTRPEAVGRKHRRATPSAAHRAPPTHQPLPRSLGEGLPAVARNERKARRGRGPPPERVQSFGFALQQPSRRATPFPGAPCPPQRSNPSPAVWGRGRRPSRGTSERPGGGEGPRRSASYRYSPMLAASRPRNRRLRRSSVPSSSSTTKALLDQGRISLT